jgi:hypothetical protein
VTLFDRFVRALRVVAPLTVLNRAFAHLPQLERRLGWRAVAREAQRQHIDYFGTDRAQKGGTGRHPHRLCQHSAGIVCLYCLTSFERSQLHENGQWRERETEEMAS